MRIDGSIELTFGVLRDGTVIDGRDLAQSLMQAAYRLLLPYANSCPGCADALFAAVANNAINEELEERGEDGRVIGNYFVVEGDDAEKLAAFEDHLESTKERTAALLERREGKQAGDIRHLVH